MADKNDPIGYAKYMRYQPETERLLKQFCRLESSVDGKAYNLRHVYMEQCGNAACSPHLTDAERALADELMRSGSGFEDALVLVLGRRDAAGT